MLFQEQEAEKFLINFKNNTNGHLVEQDITTTDLYKFFEILNNNPRVSQEEIDKYINFILNCINNKQTLVKDTVINDYISNSINETKNPELEDMRKIEILTKTNTIIDIYNNLDDVRRINLLVR